MEVFDIVVNKEILNVNRINWPGTINATVCKAPHGI